MALLKFLERPVVVDCFLPEDAAFAATYAPIQAASKFYPQWWKELPREEFSFQHMGSNNNMRGCLGFINTFRQGFVMPMWSDLAIRVSDIGYDYKFSDGLSRIEHHGNEQAGAFYNDRYFMKLITPWLMTCKRDIRVLAVGCMWNSTTPPGYTVPHGVLRLKVDPTRSAFLFVERKKQDIMIPVGTPMLHYIPLTERKIETACHVLSNSDYNKLLAEKVGNTSFIRKAINQDRIRAGKCPIPAFITGRK